LPQISHRQAFLPFVLPLRNLRERIFDGFNPSVQRHLVALPEATPIDFPRAQACRHRRRFTK